MVQKIQTADLVIYHTPEIRDLNEGIVEFGAISGASFPLHVA